MEVILISDDRVKIMLTDEDLREFDIDYGIAEGDTDLCRRFKSVLQRADDICGTHIGSERVMIQLFQSRGGGCELFVTKLPLASLPAKNKKCDGVFYVFESIGALVAVCRLLAARGHGKHSSAYFSDRTCALYIPEFSESKPLPLSAACLDEYGSRADGSTRIYISEHAHSVCSENAVEILSKL